MVSFNSNVSLERLSANGIISQRGDTATTGDILYQVYIASKLRFVNRNCHKTKVQVYELEDAKASIKNSKKLS